VIVYADSTALAKRYIAEPGSREVEAVLRRADVVGTGPITRAEVSAALARAVRGEFLERSRGEAILRAFRRHWSELTTILLTEAVVAEADNLAWEQSLRGYDAVHLACALSWQRGLGATVTLATFDRELRQAAARVGMEAWPEVLE
jgi:predicted nucleic acid-binding protein